jgi:DNA-binding transcriptional MerR regulator
MLTTNVLAKKAEVPVYTVRHYTRIGMLNPTQNETNGYKIYKQSDEILLKFIRNAKELGFKLKEISQILGEADKGNGKCTGELVGNGRRYAE